MNPGKPHIVLITQDRGRAIEIVSATSSWAEVECVSGVPAAVAREHSWHVDLAVLVVDGLPDITMAVQLLARSITNVAIDMRLTATNMRELLSMSRMVPEFTLIVRGEPGLSATILDAVESRLSKFVVSNLPQNAPGILSHFLAVALSPPYVKRIDEALTTLSLSRRSFDRTLRRHSLPTAERLLGWCRLLAASWKMCGKKCRVEDVAMELGFDSAAALASMLRRYSGDSIRMVRENDGFHRTVAAFQKEVYRGRIAPRRGVSGEMTKADLDNRHSKSS